MFGYLLSILIKSKTNKAMLYVLIISDTNMPLFFLFFLSLSWYCTYLIITAFGNRNGAGITGGLRHLTLHLHLHHIVITEVVQPWPSLYYSGMVHNEEKVHHGVVGFGGSRSVLGLWLQKSRSRWDCQQVCYLMITGFFDVCLFLFFSFFFFFYFLYL